MDIQWLSDMGKRALAQISAAVCGEELTRIMMPAPHEFPGRFEPPVGAGGAADRQARKDLKERRAGSPSRHYQPRFNF